MKNEEMARLFSEATPVFYSVAQRLKDMTLHYILLTIYISQSSCNFKYLIICSCTQSIYFIRFLYKLLRCSIKFTKSFNLIVCHSAVVSSFAKSALLYLPYSLYYFSHLCTVRA